MWVNPLPRLYAHKLLFFDFPADYRARRCFPNVNVEPPEIEELYGRLGSPPKQQGHPCIMETFPEAEDPSRYYPPYQDQIIDIDRSATINHTGRLSGSFIKFLANDKFRSIVRLDAHPLTYNGDVISLATIPQSLNPGANAANTWFWLDPKTRRELIFTAHVTFDPAKYLKAGHVYKLISRWEFWDVGVKPYERLPMSGFSEVISFSVSEKTENL
ncbi:MAG: hypothetical protein D6743_14520 [Calditrichaeota bacterium]|nr:MAG: hypothetical protein D6743_14520 [Calditrichota bacterium]